MNPPAPAKAGPLERVVVLHDFSEALGGASHLVQVLIAGLRDRGIPVTFLSGDSGAAFSRDDVDFVPMGRRPITGRHALAAGIAGLFDPVVFRRARSWIARNDTPGTVYHLHGWTKTLSPAVFAALRPVARRLVLHAHDYFNACPNGAFFDFAAQEECALAPLSGRCLARQCDKAGHAQKVWRAARDAARRGLLARDRIARLVMIHPGQAPALARGGWCAAQMVSVRNPVSPPCRARVKAEDNHGVLFIGRLSHEKGADLAARAALAAGLAITFVGEGSERGRIAACNPQATFLGRQDRPGVAAALARARIAVMPSRWSEPFGLVALEAAGSGVPVVVDRRALMAPEIAALGCGIAADTANLGDFAHILAELDRDDARISAMSHAGFAGYHRICTTQGGWVDALLREYRAVLAQSAARITPEQGEPASAKVAMP